MSGEGALALDGHDQAVREPFKKRRCLLPVLGFYEWNAAPGGKRVTWT
jgi:putative SOS response-associated peptidase YedK